MKIWAYAVIWNEEKMLDFYLRHYSKFCDKIVFFDNESDDRSHEIINSYPNTEIRTYITEGKLNDYVYLDLKTSAINDAKGNCDYVIIGDCDEFIVHPNIKEFLQTNSQYSIIYPAGFQMVSKDFPNSNGQIYDEVDFGSPDPWYSKPILIDPNRVTNFSWIEGCHEISLDSEYIGEILHPVPVEIRPVGEWDGHPWGKWKMQFEVLEQFNQFPIKLLHYKYMGVDYVNGRYIQYANRNSQENKDAGIAIQYEKSLIDGSIPSQIEELYQKSFNINLT